MAEFRVNGEPTRLELTDEDTALEVIRDRLRLTGTKQVCGAGVCGACTVQVDGEPVVSCLLPAAALTDRDLTTVEGIAATGHPVLRAFAAHAALQCGFCTPGFVVEATAFHDRWRAEHGTAEPDRDTIAAALAGHLCRCGAYPEIFQAVRDACAGRFDEAGPGDLTGPRKEAADKITGRARYTVDVHHDGQLEGVILRSTQPHAEVSVDLSGALAVPGVRAAIDLLPADRTVRYTGQEIAAVAATDRRTAEKALQNIAVAYRPLPAVTDPDEAERPDAPRVYRGGRNPPSAAEGVLVPARWRGNVRGPIGSFSIRPRKARNLIAKARNDQDPLLVEGTFRTPSQSHTAFEPHAAVAAWTDDRLEVQVSTQAVGHVTDQIAKMFDLPRDRVKVTAEHVGGGFGAKLGLTAETVAAIRLAQQAKAPVRVALERWEELSATGHRPPARLEMSLLTDRDANLKAMRLAAYADSGVAVGSTVAGLARLIYPAPAKELLDYDVVTNTPPGLPFRGPGGPLLCFALEQAVDEAARRLGKDPIALRQRWDPDPNRQRLYRWASQLPAWQDRHTLPRTGRFRRGIGVAAANWIYFWEPGCTVELAVEAGRLVAAAGFQDIGTGSRTVLARTVADQFGLSPDDVTVRLGDSTLPRGPISGGSRTTATIVPAAITAAERLKARLIATRKDLAGAQSVVGGIRHSGGLIGWAEVIAAADGVRVKADRPADRRARDVSRAFAGAGLPGMGFEWILRLLAKLRVGRGYTGAVHLAEVEVDTRLGRTRVLRVTGGHAVGRLAAPELARAQAHGGIIQGIGYALYEERQLDPATGLVLSAGLEDYRIPGIADTPEIELHFDPDGFGHVPGGGVGLAEIATLPVAAAVANAVHDATGVRPYRLPILPDRLLSALRGEA